MLHCLHLAPPALSSKPSTHPPTHAVSLPACLPARPQNKTDVHQLGLDLWRDEVVRHRRIRPRLLDMLLDMVQVSCAWGGAGRLVWCCAVLWCAVRCSAIRYGTNVPASWSTSSLSGRSPLSPVHYVLRLLSLPACVQRERGGDMIDRGLLRAMTQMLVDLGQQGEEGGLGGWGAGRRMGSGTLLGPALPPHRQHPSKTSAAANLLTHLPHPTPPSSVYCDDFEAVFLERTADFYAREAAETLARSDAPAYLAHAELRLGEELDRVGAYLDASSQAKLIKVGGFGRRWRSRVGAGVFWRMEGFRHPFCCCCHPSPHCAPPAPPFDAGGRVRAGEPPDAGAGGHGGQRRSGYAGGGQVRRPCTHARALPEGRGWPRPAAHGEALLMLLLLLLLLLTPAVPELYLAGQRVAPRRTLPC